MARKKQVKPCFLGVPFVVNTRYEISNTRTITSFLGGRKSFKILNYMTLGRFYCLIARNETVEPSPCLVLDVVQGDQHLGGLYHVGARVHGAAL